MNGKSIFTSKTFWVNAVAVAAAVAGMFGLDLTAELQGTIVATVMGVANIALRFVTKEPIVWIGCDSAVADKIEEIETKTADLSRDELIARVQRPPSD